MGKMTPERWRRVTALLDEVLACDSSQREALLAGLCDGDDDLRREVESLLRFEKQNVSVLEEPLARWHPSSGDTTNTDEPPHEIDEVGSRIGPYRVLDRLGAGGMGNVYLAARENDFRQRVALKRIKSRAMSKEVLYRFENERQILADLEHPNVARILDAGKTHDLLPYFAMEYVEGEPIDVYCDRRRLSVRRRIELVLQVCSALQLAHQNLVVHRDLKPGNILVTEAGVPKLIDFGIAKHLEPESMPHDVATKLGTQPMTLRYASPEQLWGLPITTAADIYSLGVLLYQLLTGHDPYRFDQGMLAIHRAICEHEPVKPSVAVSRSVTVELPGGTDETRTPESVSQARGTSFGKLKSTLASDLDAILLKALRKRPEDRYRSVEQLADDLRHHLEGRPVSACDGTWRYLAGKFARRHVRGLAIAGAMLAVILGSGVAMMILWRKAAHTEEVRARAERTVDLLENVIEVFDPDQSGNRVTPLEFLNRTRQQLTDDLRADPELLADMLRGPLPRVYGSLGHHKEALAALDEALIILRTLYPGDHPDLAECLLNRGTALYRLGDYDGAEQSCLAAIEMRRRLGMTGVELAVPLANLASMRYTAGKLDEAESLYREALRIYRRHLGPNAPELATQLRNLGMLELARNRPDEAESLLREALNREIVVHGAESLTVARRRSDLGRVLLAQGRLQEAERELTQAVAIQRQRFDVGHIGVARTNRNLAALMIELGELDTAEVLLTNAQPSFRHQSLQQESPGEDKELAEIESLLGALLTAQGRYLEAEICLIEGYRIIEASRGPGSIYTKQALERVINLYDKWNKPETARHYRQFSEIDSNVSHERRAAGEPAALAAGRSENLSSQVLPHLIEQVESPSETVGVDLDRIVDGQRVAGDQQRGEQTAHDANRELASGFVTDQVSKHDIASLGSRRSNQVKRRRAPGSFLRIAGAGDSGRPAVALSRHGSKLQSAGNRVVTCRCDDGHRSV